MYLSGVGMMWLRSMPACTLIRLDLYQAKARAAFARSAASELHVDDG